MTAFADFYVDIRKVSCYNSKAGSEGKTFDRNVMLDKTAG